MNDNNLEFLRKEIEDLKNERRLIKERHEHLSRGNARERTFTSEQGRKQRSPEGVALSVLEPPLPGSNVGRLASTVVTSKLQEEFPSHIREKRKLVNSNPEVKQRNKRLFGSLLGTLQKFQEEDLKFKKSKVAQSRAEAELRADERAATENLRLREKRQHDVAKAKITEMNKMREVNLKLQAKEYEMLMTRSLTHELNLACFLKTITKPPLLWLPMHHNEDTMLRLQQRSLDINVWKDAQLCKIEKAKNEILSRYHPVSIPQIKSEIRGPANISNEMRKGEVEAIKSTDNNSSESLQVEECEKDEPASYQENTC